jgi:hypothetical protein
MPLWLAIEVARLPSDEVQVAMVAAYGAGTLKGDPNGAAQQRGEPVVAQCWARRTVKGRALPAPVFWKKIERKPSNAGPSRTPRGRKPSHVASAMRGAWRRWGACEAADRGV